MRAFLAGCIDPAAARQLHAALQGLTQLYRGAAYRWIDPGNYHITLRFFGELDAADVDRVLRCVPAVAVRHSNIVCTTGALQALPGARRPSVIALSLESAGNLEALGADMNAALAADFGAPDKPFKAHLTVVRCRRGARFLAAPALAEWPLVISSVALFESATSGAGPRYTPLATLRLGADQVIPS